MKTATIHLAVMIVSVHWATLWMVITVQVYNVKVNVTLPVASVRLEVSVIPSRRVSLIITTLPIIGGQES